MSLDTYLAIEVQFGYILESNMYLGFAYLAVEGTSQVRLTRPVMHVVHTYRRRLGLTGSGPQRPDVSNTSRTWFRSRTSELYTRFRFQIPEHLRKLHTGTCGDQNQKHRDHGLSGKPGIRYPTVPDGPGMLVQPKK
ncbi:uncharacterized protein B0T23DRAFT_401799 [Neurospora hispaniola]|uniref:Uncharacterized protein n=1 Tax=Neurospora hispaniola TaxID=588809 RepID=A0AAJ0IHF8_9PEZI|nr:hypothetical protein B0T23DRAFT_401799 [Neurospora hispaniola]